MGVAEGVDLAPVEFEGGGVGAEVEEGEDGGAVGVDGDPGLLDLLAQALDVERGGGAAGLVDGDEVAVGDEGEVGAGPCG